METTTFPALIQDGKIVTNHLLTDFEGKDVFITVTVPKNKLDNEITPPIEDPEILDDLGPIQMAPKQTKKIQVNIVNVERHSMPIYPSYLEDK